MSSVNLINERPRRSADGPGFGNYIIRVIVALVIDVLLFFFVTGLLREGFTFTAATAGLIGLAANVILLYNPAYPIRWMLIGLVLNGDVCHLPHHIHGDHRLYQFRGWPSA